MRKYTGYLRRQANMYKWRVHCQRISLKAGNILIFIRGLGGCPSATIFKGFNTSKCFLKSRKNVCSPYSRMNLSSDVASVEVLQHELLQ